VVAAPLDHGSTSVQGSGFVAFPVADCGMVGEVSYVILLMASSMASDADGLGGGVVNAAQSLCC
jgi:hypothetical protein